MKNRIHAAMLMGCAGLTSGLALAQEPTVLQPDSGHIVEIAHIYYNIVTGERLVTLAGDDQTSPADTGNSISVWSTRGPAPDCYSNGGGNTSFYYALDNPGSTSLSTAVTLLDYGDIELDTVVDCVTINWIVAHPDTDTDSDSIGDGVEELAGEWTVYDADNGRFFNQSTRLPVVNFLFFNLPGNVAGPGSLSSYTANIDLVGAFTGTDLSFELGDSDGDCQSAAHCNSSVFDNATGMFLPIAQCDNDFDSLPDSDLDGDGLFDFSWTVRFYQPGIGNDFDSDNDTGMAAPTNADSIGVQFGFPSGLYELPGGGFGIDPTVPDAGTGAENRAVLINEAGEYAGGLSFGGFQCPDDNHLPGVAAIFAFQLWGPGGVTPCYADFNNDGMLNFFDFVEFIACYQNGYPGLCDCDHDGDLDYFDISCFVYEFLYGCNQDP